MTSLNPCYTIGSQVKEPINVHQHIRGEACVQKAIEALKLLRIPSPESSLSYYPHQMSGGMRQRVAGGIALSCNPGLLIADEPTTSLDVTIQNSYLKTLDQVQKETGVALIFITHDFGIVSTICQFVNVMYAGKIVERSSVIDLFNNPGHPYTKALLSCLPSSKPRWERLPTIPGRPPDLGTLLPGCYFSPRCSEVMDICKLQYPEEIEIGENHYCSCWRVG
jgi:oligopeptide/dipeptide ABC transporter ATP-binding protein